MGKEIMRSLLLLFALLSLAGCQTPITPESAASIDLSKNGILVVSVRKKGDPEDVKKVTVEFYLRGQTPGTTSPFVNSSKELWVLAVPPGDYSISDWYMVVAQEKRASSEQKYAFTVKAGSITYIGCLESEVEREKDMFGLKWVPKASPRVRDMRQEDVSAFRSAYPAWSSLDVDFQVADGFEWKDVQTSRGKIPGI